LKPGLNCEKISFYSCDQPQELREARPLIRRDLGAEGLRKT